MDSIFIELAVILSVAFIISYLIRLLKQPAIIGYIFAGMLIGPFILKFGASTGIIDSFSKFGIAFLLFIVGLHLNPRIIREIGTSSLLIGLAQVVLTFGIGFFISSVFLGFSSLASAYIGVALAFSSTIIVMKILSDKQHLDSLYGKIATGILIIQDLVAIGVLMFLSSLSSKTALGSVALKSLLVGGGLLVFLFLLGFFVLPRITKGIARYQELLFLFSIFWCFLIAALFGYAGFSIEIGALVAGVVLSLSPYSTEISSKIRPLRDFFLIIFFIILGLNIEISNIDSVLVNAIILSLVVLILKPIITMALMALFRYTKRTNFLVGTALAQISEFSLIILVLGVSIGHISSDVLYTLTLALVITIFLSTYMMVYSKQIYNIIPRFVSIFERKKVRKEKSIQKKYDAILFGYNRTGFRILQAFKQLKKDYLVVDFNPDTIEKLSRYRVPCLYGDVDDTELLNELQLDKVQLVVSTVPDFDTNLLLLETFRLVNSNGVIIVRAHSIPEALELYKAGATYVLTPHFLGGEYVAKMLKDLKLSKAEYREEREKHIKMLLEIMGRED